MEKYGTARKGTDDKLTQAVRTLYNLGYKRTLKMTNSYIFTATMVTRMCRNITLHVNRLLLWILKELRYP